MDRDTVVTELRNARSDMLEVSRCVDAIAATDNPAELAEAVHRARTFLLQALRGVEGAAHAATRAAPL